MNAPYPNLKSLQRGLDEQAVAEKLGIKLDYLFDDTGRVTDLKDKAMLKLLKEIEGWDHEGKQTVPPADPPP